MYNEFACVAVDAAPRCIKNSSHAAEAHGFEHVVGKKRPLTEIDVGFRDCLRDIGVRGQMDHNVMTCHRFGQKLRVADFAARNAEPGIGKMMGDMPVPSRREIIVNRHRGSAGQAHQMIAEMTAYKTCPTDDKVTCHLPTIRF